MPYERPYLQLKFPDGSVSKSFYKYHGLLRAIRDHFKDIKIICPKNNSTFALKGYTLEIPKKVTFELFKLLNPNWKPGILSKSHEALVLINRDGVIEENKREKWGAVLLRLQQYGFVIPTGIPQEAVAAPAPEELLFVTNTVKYNKKCKWSLTDKGLQLLEKFKNTPASKLSIKVPKLAEDLSTILFKTFPFVSWVPGGGYKLDTTKEPVNLVSMKNKTRLWKHLELITTEDEWVNYHSFTDKGKNLIKRRLESLLEYSVNSKILRTKSNKAHFTTENVSDFLPEFLSKFVELKDAADYMSRFPKCSKYIKIVLNDKTDEANAI